MSHLPPNWATASLSDLIGDDGIVTDGDWVESKDQDPRGAVRLTQLADVGDGVFRDRSSRFLTEESAGRLNCTPLKSGDIMIARMPAPLGRACLYPGSVRPAVTVVDVCIVRPHRDINLTWLMWAINSPQYRELIRQAEKGTTRKRISKKNLIALALPIPPTEEQHRIALTLESHLSRLDSGIHQMRRCTLSVGQARAAFLRTASAGRYGHTGSPEDLPAGWALKELSEIAEVVGGVTKDAKRQTDNSLVEVPYLRVANVQRGHLDLTKVATIRVTADKAKRLALTPGDVLLNEGGDRDKLGRGWVWSGEIDNCIHQNHVFRVRLNRDSIHPKLFSWYANTAASRWFEARGKQTTNLASISMSTVKRLPVPIPPLHLQEAMVVDIESFLADLHRLETTVSRSIRGAEALRAALLQAAFTGRLVPQDPRDEPASILLDRIRTERNRKREPTAERRQRTTAAEQWGLEALCE